MRKAIDAARMGKLVAIQQLRRDEAETVLSSARRAAGLALAQEQAARDAAGSAHADWTTVLARPGFAPDHARWLADLVGARDGALTKASDRRRHADSVHQRREDDWRRADAIVRSAETILARVRRAEASRREESRLAALADRTTADWRAR